MIVGKEVEVFVLLASFLNNFRLVLKRNHITRVQMKMDGGTDDMGMDR